MFNKLKETISGVEKASRNDRVRTSSNTSTTSHLNPADREQNTESENNTVQSWLLSDSLLADDSDAASVISSCCPSEADGTDWQLRFNRVRHLAQTYKSKCQKLKEAYVGLRDERDRLNEQLHSRRTDVTPKLRELQEQIELEKLAKRDVETNYCLILSEKEECIQVLRLQISLLKEGKDLPPELEAKIHQGHQQEVERQRANESEYQEMKIKLEHLSSQLSQMTNQLERETGERNRLEETLKDYEERSQLAASQSAQCDQLRRDLADSQFTSSTLREQVDALKQKLVDSVKKEQSFEEHVQHLTSQVESLQETILSRDSELTSLEQKLVSSQTNMSGELADLQQRLSQTLKDLSESEATIVTLRDKNARLESELNQALSVQQQTSADFDRIRAEYHHLESQLESLRPLQTECDRLREDQNTLAERDRVLTENLFRMLESDNLVPDAHIEKLRDDPRIEHLVEQLLDLLHQMKTNEKESYSSKSDILAEQPCHQDIPVPAAIQNAHLASTQTKVCDASGSFFNHHLPPSHPERKSVSALKDALADAKHQLSAIRSGLQSLRSYVHDILISETSHWHGQLEATISALQDQWVDEELVLKEKLYLSEAQLSVTEDNLSLVRSQLNEQTACVEELKSTLNGEDILKAEVEQLKSMRAVQDVRIQHLEDTVAELKEELALANLQPADAVPLHAVLALFDEGLNQYCPGSFKRDSDRLDDLVTQLQAADERLTSLQKCVNALQSSQKDELIIGLKTELDETKSNLANLEEMRSSLSAELDDRKNQMTLLQSQLAEAAHDSTVKHLLQCVVDEFRKRLQLIQNKPNTQLVEQVNGLTFEALSNSESFWESLVSISGQLDLLVAEKLTEFEHLTECKHQLEDTVQQLTSELRLMTEERTTLEEQLTLTRSRFEQSEAELQSTLNESQSEVNQLKSQLSQVEQAASEQEHRIREQLALVQTQLEQSNSRVNDSTMALCEKESQLISRESQLQDLSSKHQAAFSALLERLIDEFSKRCLLLPDERRVSVTEQLDILSSESVQWRESYDVHSEAVLMRLDAFSNQLDTLSEQIINERSQWEEVKRQLEATVKRLTEELQTTTEVREHLELQLQNTAMKLSQSEQSHSQKIANLEALVNSTKVEVDGLQVKLDEAKTSLVVQEEQWKQKLAVVEEQLSLTRSKLNDSAVALCEKESQIIKLATQQSELSSCRTNLLDEVNCLRSLVLNSIKVRLSLARELAQHLGSDSHMIFTQLDTCHQLYACLDVPNAETGHPGQNVDFLQQLESKMSSVYEQLTQLHAERRSQREAERQRLSEAEQAISQRRELEEKLRITSAELSSVKSTFDDEIKRARHTEVTHSNLITQLETKLNEAQQECSKTQATLSEKADLVFSLELQLQEFKESRAATSAELMEKDKELQSLRVELDGYKGKLENGQELIKLVQDERSKLQSKLTQLTISTEEKEKQLIEDRDAQIAAVENATQQREKRLKQQLKESKNRYKQLLHECESLRHSSQEATPRETELSSQLSKVQEDLLQSHANCTQLEQRIHQLQGELDELRKSEQNLRATVEAERSHSLSVDDLRETYQNDMENLKADYAQQMREMQERFERQLRDREVELRSTLNEPQGSKAKSLQQKLDKTKEQLAIAIRENEELQSRLQDLEASKNRLDESLMVDSGTQSDPDAESISQPTPVICPKCGTTSPSAIRQAVEDTAANGSSAPSVELFQSEYSLQTSASPLPSDPMNLARPTSWVEQLRNEILHSKSIDSLHPAVRPGHFVSPVTQADYEALQLHNADLQNQLHQLALEFEALRSSCKACGSASSPLSPAFSPSMGSLHEMVEYEYLRNVLFEYMLGRETMTLSKVLCSLMRFSAEQTKRIMQHEDAKARSWTIESRTS